MLSAVGVVRADVQVVRLLHGDEIAGGPGFQEREVDVECNGEVVLEHQPVQAGSYVVVPDASGALLPDGSFTVHAFIWPTTPGKGRQGLVTQWSAPQRRGWGARHQRARSARVLGLVMAAGWPKSPATGRSIRGSGISSPRRLTPTPARWCCIKRGVVNAYNSLLSPILEDVVQLRGRRATRRAPASIGRRPADGRLP